jgi:phosphatidylserine decarboxylase
VRYSTSPIIAREAFPYAFAIGVAFALCLLFWWIVWAFGLLVAGIYVLWFFRNPSRTAATGANLVIAPADGRVVAAGIVASDEFPDGQALRIAVFMSLFNCHINWSPCSATVLRAEYHPGLFLNAMEDKASEENEHKTLLLKTPAGQKLVVKLVAGLVARRIVCPLEEGDEVVQGERIGLIQFGSRVETLLPASSVLRVAPGMGVTGSRTVLAELQAPETTGQEF